MKFKLLEGVLLYRGTTPNSLSSKFNQNFGVFFTDSKQGASLYGDVNKYTLKDDANIFVCKSSFDFCEENSLLDVEFNFIPTMLSTLEEQKFRLYNGEVISTKDIKTLNQLDNIEIHDFHHPIGLLFYAITQRIVFEVLNDQYDGVHYFDEDTSNPSQYQIWNLDKVKRHEV